MANSVQLLLQLPTGTELGKTESDKWKQAGFVESHSRSTTEWVGVDVDVVLG